MKFLWLVVSVAAAFLDKNRGQAWKVGVGALQTVCDTSFSELPSSITSGGDWSIHPSSTGSSTWDIKNNADGLVTGTYKHRGPSSLDTSNLRGIPEGSKGWSDVHMSFSEGGALNDNQKMYSAGVLEGAMTAGAIKDFYENTKQPDRVRQGLDDLLMPEIGLLGERANSTGMFWTQARAMGCQFLGMHKGYHMVRDQNPDLQLPDITRADFFDINIDGEIDFAAGLLADVNGAESFLEASSRGQRGAPVDPSSAAGLLTDQPVDASWKPGRCSALVKFTGKSLLVGHTTWEGYKEQVRSMKRYNFPLEGTKAKEVVFSSYPGCVSSTDDWVVGDNGLVITETTTNLMSQNRAYMKAPHVPDFIQVMANFRNAESGEDFVDKFIDNGKFLTGWYNSEWMVVDYNKMHDASDAAPEAEASTTHESLIERRVKTKTKKALRPGTLYILDAGPGISGTDSESLLEFGSGSQTSTAEYSGDEKNEFTDLHGFVPGTTLKAKVYKSKYGSAAVMDATSLLDTGKGYWASYNEPGLPPMGTIQGRHHSNRQTIFDQVQTSINSVEDLAIVMRRNEQEDGAGRTHAIAPRGDLEMGGEFGGTDTKVVDEDMVAKVSLAAISGPTAVVDQKCQPFVWNRPVSGIEQTMDAPWMMFDKAQKGGKTVLDTKIWSGEEGERTACFGAKDTDSEAYGQSLLQARREISSFS